MGNKLTSSLNGLNALICGSTSGIGLTTAHEFSESGASVTLFARNEEKLKHTLSSLPSSDGQKHKYLVGDFNAPKKIKEIVTSS